MRTLSALWNGWSSARAVAGRHTETVHGAVIGVVHRFAHRHHQHHCGETSSRKKKTRIRMPSSLHPLPVLQQLACGQQQCFGLPTTSTWGYLNLRAASRQQRFLHSTEGKLVPARRENGGENGVSGGDNGNSDDDGDGDGAARENLLTIPNVLTVSRMAATPYLGWLLAQGDLQPALALFFVAGVTDALDGWIARTWPSQATVIGGVIDPIADKFLICTVAVGLGYAGLVPVWLVALMFGRDAWLISSSLYIRAVSLRAHVPTVTWGQYWDFGYPTVIVSPTGISKANTMVQGFVLLGSLISPILIALELATKMLVKLTAVLRHQRARKGADAPAPVALEAAWAACGLTTFGSGASYLYAKDALVFLRPPTDEFIHRLPGWASSRLEATKRNEDEEE